MEMTGDTVLKFLNEGVSYADQHTIYHVERLKSSDREQVVYTKL